MIKKNVLVVGGENIRQEACPLMRELGYEIFEAEGVQRALYIINSSGNGQPDLIVTAHKMSVQHCGRLIRELREMGNEIPVVVIGSKPRPEDETELLAYGKTIFTERNLLTTDSLRQAIKSITTCEEAALPS